MESNPTYDLFFTGREDPRSCTIIGEDTKPVFFSFETLERGMMFNTRTNVMLYSEKLVATLDWSPGDHMGSFCIGSSRMSMSQLVLPGSVPNARGFFSSVDGRRFEWRKSHGGPASYDLFLLPNNVQVAAYRRYISSTTVGPSHGLLQYKFSNDLLLLESLLSLCLVRWIDTWGL
ncbi:hypothetical protein K435DRAFT_672549 [Dendrothele bispora CBS 962.96]|uniref:DUF6593 domain-containing protein n=1 Tax=Dendrothele bispora (strain CBS 962.96) TaxID=1314807 RepID=A0A4S8LMX1_DENBC|nr:hypothetical protein K435DRAFT_675616 [Dendrothele bispora CBS 962.96]THU92164.1 hypothetical protein K435DRAFT_672549 [Dendrothele bispora CBS 962.96]